MSDEIDQILRETTSQRTLAPFAVVSQVALMLGVSVREPSVARGQTLTVRAQLATVLMFNVLRPRNKVSTSPSYLNMHCSGACTTTCWSQLEGINGRTCTEDSGLACAALADAQGRAQSDAQQAVRTLARHYGVTGCRRAHIALSCHAHKPGAVRPGVCPYHGRITFHARKR